VATGLQFLSSMQKLFHALKISQLNGLWSSPVKCLDIPHSQFAHGPYGGIGNRGVESTVAQRVCWSANQFWKL